MAKTRIACPLDHCNAPLVVFVDDGDASVGVQGGTLEEFSGSCRHVPILNRMLGSESFEGSFEAILLEKAVNEFYERERDDWVDDLRGDHYGDGR